MTQFTVTITFTADADAEHLGTPQEVQDEVRSWLESLGADVREVVVQKVTPGERPEPRRAGRSAVIVR